MTRFQIEVIEGDFLNRLELCDELVYQDAIVFRVIGEAVEVTCLKEYRFKKDNIPMVELVMVVKDFDFPLKDGTITFS